MAVHYVILECDWFVLGSQRLIKQLAFYDTYNHVTGQYVFRFPERLLRYATYFARQSENSHHIPWNKPGFLYLCDVSAAIQTIKFLLKRDSVRALLCHRCNRSLILLRDSPELLRKAADYLENFQKGRPFSGRSQT